MVSSRDHSLRRLLNEEAPAVQIVITVDVSFFVL
jgi:hypothetical protein